MKFSFCVFFLLVMLNNIANGQFKNEWHSFTDKKNNLIGYKDSRGRVKIPAIFSTTGSSVLKTLVAVFDDKTHKSYYLLKNGKRLGIDSLYVYDNGFDRVIENKIRFRDRKTDKVGFFDPYGKIIIPAFYNDAEPFHNGFALVVHDGKRLCADGSPFNIENPCEHWYWNGTSAIIDTKNKIIAENLDIKESDNINWFSLSIRNSVPDTTLYTSFKALNGKFYCFVNYQKEFKKWFYQNYLGHLGNQNIVKNCYKELIVEGNFKNKIREYYYKAAFLKQFESLLLSRLTVIKSGEVETNIFREDLNNYIYTGKNFQCFFINNGEFNNPRYPVFNVVATFYNKDKSLNHQEQFSFIRTNNGFKLIEIAKVL